MLSRVNCKEVNLAFFNSSDSHSPVAQSINCKLYITLHRDNMSKSHSLVILMLLCKGKPLKHRHACKQQRRSALEQGLFHGLLVPSAKLICVRPLCPHSSIVGTAYASPKQFEHYCFPTFAYHIIIDIEGNPAI